VSDIVVSAAIRNTVNAINRTQAAFDKSSLKLASGLEVNSALDNPQNFFTAQSLNNRASDLTRLLDGIGQSIRTVEESINGVQALDRLLNQAEAVVQESVKLLEAGNIDPAIYQKEVNTSPDPLNQQILESNPDFYYRLNNTLANTGSGTSGGVASLANGASLGGGAIYGNGSGNDSVQFDGINDRISVTDSNLINLNTTDQRTVELTFNADSVSGRQVLYEEGANVNGFTIYIDNGDIRVTAEDDAGASRFFNLDISAPIVAGQTYHVAFVYSGANVTGNGNPSTFIGYLDGAEIGRESTGSDTVFPSHSGDIGIGGANGGVQFHDGEDGTASGYNFAGRISDVAIYNRSLGAGEIANHANSLNGTTSLISLNREYSSILEQIDRLVVDANYRGINLLGEDDLTTYFNENNSSKLITKGSNFRWQELGLSDRTFDSIGSIKTILSKIRPAILEVREFGRTLSNDLNIITNRRNYTEETINSLRSGADDLTLIDQNREGANLLANQTRLSLATTALSLAAQSQSSTLRLF